MTMQAAVGASLGHRQMGGDFLLGSKEELNKWTDWLSNDQVGIACGRNVVYGQSRCQPARRLIPFLKSDVA